MEKRLYRSDENKVICGVCGGLGEYFNIDPTIVRLLWAILVFSGPGIFAYIVAAIIMPKLSGMRVPITSAVSGASEDMNQ